LVSIVLRSLALLTCALLFALPATAHDIPRDDIVGVTTLDGETYYVSACVFNPLEDVTVGLDDTHAHLPRVGDCFESGVFLEANGHEGLQVRAGVAGNLAYRADERVLP
jgi:hypothetical protein